MEEDEVEEVQGEIDNARLIRKLKADGFDGAICVEYAASKGDVEAGWDFEQVTSRMKEIVEQTVAAS